VSKDEGTIGVDGVIEWRDAEGELHRAGGPARVFPSGRQEWFHHGRLHRNDGPAVEHANGSFKYYVNGVRHREGAPACVYVNGTAKAYATATTAPPQPTPTAAKSGSSRASGCAKRQT
jgi:hypothetical protein